MEYNIPFSPIKNEKIQRVIIKNKKIIITGKRKIKKIKKIIKEKQK
jgi:hypothetical protein